jgi:hypothetical protein
MKLHTLIVFSMLAIPAVTLAEKPTTRPMFPNGGKMGRRDFMPAPKATQQEIDDTLAFVKTNFKNHYELFSRIPETAPFRNMAIQKMVNRYRQLMRTQDQNPEIYETMLKQAKIEDDAIGFARDVAEKRPDADVRLHEAVRHMVDRGLDERRERIEKLRAALDDQEKKLKEDEQNRDDVIAAQIDRIKQEYQRMVQGPRHGGDSGQSPESKEINASQK